MANLYSVLANTIVQVFKMAHYPLALAFMLTLGIVHAFTKSVITDESVPPGFMFDGTCSPQVQSVVISGLQMAGLYAQAAVAAAESGDQTLLNFFFHSTDKRFVSRAFGRLNSIAARQEKTTVIFICPSANTFQDVNGAAANVFPQIDSGKLTPKNNFITIGSNFVTLFTEADPNPCKQSDLDFDLFRNVGATSPGLVLLHEVLHLPYLIGPQYDVILDLAKTTSDAHALTLPNAGGLTFQGVPSTQVAPVWSINNYVIFAKWAWIQQQQRTQCASIPSLWGALGDGAPADRTELRRLLGEPDSPPATESFNSTTVVPIDPPSDTSSFYSNATFSSSFNISGVEFQIVSGLSYSGFQRTTIPEQATVQLTYSNSSTGSTSGSDP